MQTLDERRRFAMQVAEQYLRNGLGNTAVHDLIAFMEDKAYKLARAGNTQEARALLIAVADLEFSALKTITVAAQ